jgi:hypothetical protein
MSIKQINIIDSVAVSDEDGRLLLIISDELDWKKTQDHLEVLEKKLDLYLSCINNGEIYEIFPQGKGRPISIQIYAKFKFPQKALEYLEVVNKKVASWEFGVEIKIEEVFFKG